MHNKVKMFSRKTGEVYSVEDAFLNLDQEINDWIDKYSVKVLNTSFTNGKMYYVPGYPYLHFDVMAFVTYEHVNGNPATPTFLNATNLTGSSLTLNWQYNDTSVSPIPIEFFMIYKDGNLIGKSTTTSFDVTGLTKGETYSFKVKAYNVVGNYSSDSLVLSVNSEDTTSPSVPLNLDVYAVNKTSVVLQWNKSTDSGSGIKNYVIYKDGNRCGSSKTTTFEVMYLEPNTTYSFEIRAVDNFGNQSTASNSVTTTTLT